jgi:hypothetical protein
MNYRDEVKLEPSVGGLHTSFPRSASKTKSKPIYKSWARPVVKKPSALPETVVQLSDSSEEDIVGVRMKRRANGIEDGGQGSNRYGSTRAAGVDEEIEQ